MRIQLTGGAELKIAIDEFQDFIFILDKPDARNTETGTVAIWMSEEDITAIGKVIAGLR